MEATFQVDPVKLRLRIGAIAANLNVPVTRLDCKDPLRTRLYEYVAALEHDCFPYPEAPPEMKEAHGLPMRDMGIDALSDTVALQAKCYEKSKSIPWGKLSTFIGLATNCDPPFEHTLVVAPPGVTLRTPALDLEYAPLSLEQFASTVEECKEEWRDAIDEKDVSEQLMEKVMENEETLPDAEDQEESEEEESEVNEEELEEEGPEANEGAAAGEEEPMVDEETGDSIWDLDDDHERNAIIDDSLRLAAFTEMLQKFYNSDILKDIDWIEFRKGQIDCLNFLDGCGAGEFFIQMACGSGKTAVIVIDTIRMIKAGLKVCIAVPSLLVLHQFEAYFKRFGVEGVILAGTSYNGKLEARLSSDHETALSGKWSVAVAVYDSVHLLEGVQFDVLYVDEAHHLFKPEIYANMEDSLGPQAEAINNIVANRRVYLSGTLDRADFTYSLEESIRDGVNVDFDLYLPVAEQWGAQALCDLLELHPEFSSVIVFCSRKSVAEDLCATMIENAIDAACIFGTTRKKQRNSILDRFKDRSIRVLCSVQVLVEGVDLPCADTAVFYSKKTSQTAIIQSICRVLRAAPGKLIANVVIPEEFEEGMMRKFMSAIKSVHHKFGEKGVGSRMGYICAQAGFEVGSELLDVGVYERFISGVGYDWVKTLNQVVAWRDEHGVLPKHGSSDPEEKRLAWWIQDQKTIYKKGLLSQNRIEKLKEINISLSVIKRESFDSMCRQLKTWLEENHGIMPKYHSTNPDEKRLTTWIGEQRKAYKKEIIDTYKVTRLQGMGISFARLDDQFDAACSQLKTWIAGHERLPKSNSLDPEEARLARWIHSRRQEYAKDKLSTDRVAKLEEMRIPFSQRDSQFDIAFKQLGTWIDEHSRFPKQNSSDPEENRLATFVNHQRQECAKGKLSQERIEQLESLPGWKWSVRSRASSPKADGGN